LINLNISDTKYRSSLANLMYLLRNCITQMTVVLRSTDHRLQSKTILFDRYTGTMIGTYRGSSWVIA